MRRVLIAAVGLTQDPYQLPLLDRDARHQPQRWDDGAHRQGQPIAGADTETQAESAAGRYRKGGAPSGTDRG